MVAGSWQRQIATKAAASGSDALCDWVTLQGGGLKGLKIEAGDGNRGFELVACQVSCVHSPSLLS